jgi:hypothetical protein
MGGTSEKTINGLRMHINNSNVHVHDDSKSLKFECSTSSFKSQVEDAIKELSSDDGIIKITGTKDDLCIVKDGNTLSMFIAQKSSNIKTELQTFLKDC